MDSPSDILVLRNQRDGSSGLRPAGTKGTVPLVCDRTCPLDIGMRILYILRVLEIVHNNMIMCNRRYLFGLAFI